ncbi:Translation initiation factor eif3 [Fasciola hepatica]|uniref:tRNA (adenine(58)-N(1))-methyltransferase non-catalytic subunit TRM6 n=1 Tax=Fasciola hepatica TaxID=6192 RepID=A0A2H1BRF1_FASHE|nr:Translation initiation factor eif3 [Fasciola hepatica]
MKVCLKNAIGLPYGTVFAVKGTEIEPISFEETVDQPIQPSSDVSLTDGAVPLGGKDNRDIMDCTLNQKLDFEDIKMLQSSGSTAEDIVNELVKGNANFVKKTKFSQEKYLKKKRRRYFGLFSIERPCSRILCELYSKLRRDKCL